MTTEQQIEAIVLKDEHGNVYALPKTLLEQFRLPDEQREQLEGDVQGFSTSSGTWNWGTYSGTYQRVGDYIHISWGSHTVKVGGPGWGNFWNQVGY
jgi:hypothetical protein